MLNLQAVIRCPKNADVMGSPKNHRGTGAGRKESEATKDAHPSRAAPPPTVPEAEPERPSREHSRTTTGSLTASSKQAREGQPDLQDHHARTHRGDGRGAPEPSHELPRKPATMQTGEIGPERLRFVACTHLVPVPHGWLSRNGTEQGVDSPLTSHCKHQ